MEAVAFHVIGKAAGTPDAGDEHRLRRVRTQLRQRALHGLEDRVIPATRAPTDLLVGFPVLERGFEFSGCVHVKFSALKFRCWQVLPIAFAY